MEEVKDILIKLGEPFAEVITGPGALLLLPYFLLEPFICTLRIRWDQELENFLEPYKQIGDRFHNASRELILSISERKKKLFPHEHYTFGSFAQGEN